MQPVNSTFSKETNNVRTGRNAVRLDATGGTPSNNIEFRLTDEITTYLRGKTITYAAWVFVPDISEYDASDDTSQISKPTVFMTSFDGSTMVNGSSEIANHHNFSGAGSFF